MPTAENNQNQPTSSRYLDEDTQNGDDRSVDSSGDANPRASTSRGGGRGNQLDQKAREMSERGKKLAERAKEVRELKKQHGLRLRRRSKSEKAGLLFPVDRVLRELRKSFPHHRVNEAAGVYLTSVLEYMCSELVDLSGISAQQRGKKRISPQDVKLAIGDDAELMKLLSDVVIAQGGVLPFIHKELLPKEAPKFAKKVKPSPATAKSTPKQESVAKKRKSSEISKRKKAAVAENDEEEKNEDDEELEERQATKKPRKDAFEDMSQEDREAVLKYFKNVSLLPKPGMKIFNLF